LVKIVAILGVIKPRACSYSHTPPFDTCAGAYLDSRSKFGFHA